MFYTLRHVTQFEYTEPVSESVMEARMHPRSEGAQRCLSFQLKVTPRARVFSYRDHLGNVVHHFDVPGRHARLKLVAESQLEVGAPMPLAPLGPSAWRELDGMVAHGDYWEMLTPSKYVCPTEALVKLKRDLAIERGADPVTTLLEVNRLVYGYFDYVPKSTRVDSPIDEAIETKQGVCQDFAHISLALMRLLRIPCRYVSGYIYHRKVDDIRSAEESSHAWVEALLPHYGWVGIDPTNNIIAADRHIRTAIGRDYDDVPPTRGVFRGVSESKLSVTVKVSPDDAPPPADDLGAAGEWNEIVAPELESDFNFRQQQQQQQQ